jgi:hypothetical protein
MALTEALQKIVKANEASSNQHREAKPNSTALSIMGASLNKKTKRLF